MAESFLFGSKSGLVIAGQAFKIEVSFDALSVKTCRWDKMAH